MAGHEWEDWFEREEFIGQISDIRVQNLQVERELVQKRTFTRWMNLHLEKCDPPIEVQDLFRDIQDGHILMALLEELSGCKLLHGFKKSSHRIFRLNNIAKVLSFLEERNVKLVSIDAADVADGNSSIVLGLIWNIILFFQIKELTGNIRSQFPSSSSLSSIPTSSDSDNSYCSTPSDERRSASAAMREHSKAIKKLLQWVQKRTRKYSVAVQDFGKSWTSGLAFLAVIKSIDPSLVDMRKALLRTAKENLEDGFRIAHYSLGIPRLLEPEDLTINAPDEQSIMTYVAQFLEHFPGIEEPEDSCRPIERSISMGRLNFRDSDSNHMRNSAHRSRVKERSYMFQRACTQPPPKIFISSVSEDRSAVSPPFRPAAARSWSTEDFLADSTDVEDVSSSVVEVSTESASEVSTNSPQLSDIHSPTGSSATVESAIGDSAIHSPDSWVESEFGVMPEKFCESPSDGSLCDSGTAWDVYRATPIEVTAIDEGFVPSAEDRAPDESSINEAYVDEGIYSLSSLESTQERVQEEKQVEEGKEKEANLEKINRDVAPDHSKSEITREDARQSPEQEPSFGLCDAEELADADKSNQSQLKQTSFEESTHRERECLKKAGALVWEVRDYERRTEGQNEGNNAKESEGETECQENDSLSEETREESRDGSGSLKGRGEGVGETPDEVSEGLLRDHADARERFSSETLVNARPTNQDRASEAGLDPSTGINIPLISISSEPGEQEEEPGRLYGAGDDEVRQAEGTDADVPQNLQDLSCDHDDNVARKSTETPSDLGSENVKPTASEQIRDTESGRAEERDMSRSSNADASESKQERESPISEKDSSSQTSSSDAKSHREISEQEVDLHQDQLVHAGSDDETATAQQNALESVNSKPNGTAGIAFYEPGGVSRDRDLFYADFDQSCPTVDVVGDPIEPMDLFYPDKEEHMFTEPPDTEMQSWPSVLSVSALQPAPASENPPEPPLDPPGEDFRNTVDPTQDKEKMIMKTSQETDQASETQEDRLLPGETTGGLWGDAPADGSDLSEAEQRRSGSARENTASVRSDSNERQIPPVLRHRKGARFTAPTDNQTAAPREANGDSDLWCGESTELYLLLLLWLLLYCFWLLPQMDLKTLPSLLLNLHH